MVAAHAPRAQEQGWLSSPPLDLLLPGTTFPQPPSWSLVRVGLGGWGRAGWGGLQGVGWEGAWSVPCRAGCGQAGRGGAGRVGVWRSGAGSRLDRAGQAPSSGGRPHRGSGVLAASEQVCPASRSQLVTLV